MTGGDCDRERPPVLLLQPLPLPLSLPLPAWAVFWSPVVPWRCSMSTSGGRTPSAICATEQQPVAPSVAPSCRALCCRQASKRTSLAQVGGWPPLNRGL